MNPLLRKRWSRFRRHRRGFWSLCLLGGLYFTSLLAEFICHDRPIVMRFAGQVLFPVFRYYSDDYFTGSGLKTRPDYKQLEKSDIFRKNPENWMIFPPVRNGPYEIIRPETLRGEERIQIRARPAPVVGSINIDVNYLVTRSQSAELFLPASASDRLDSRWSFSGSLRNAIENRFLNKRSDSFREIITAMPGSSTPVEVSMPEFAPRSQPPRDIRLTFREQTTRSSDEHAFIFSRDGRVAGAAEGFWGALDPATQRELETIATNALSGGPVAENISMNGVAYKLAVEINAVAWPHRPVRGHWLGIDNAGRDVFARILYGLRTSMTFGLILVLISMGLGIMLGAVQGYYGGRVDMIGQRAIEIWSTIPFLYVMILLGSIYGRSFSLLLFCYGIFNWIGISYYVRAEFLRLRNAAFVDAARCLGLSSSRIMFRHILPNALTPVITFFPFSLVGAIGSLAMLDYLGFGLPPPVPSWGELLQQAQAFRWAWWLILYPSVALFVVILLGVFIGEGVRDASDPKPVSRME